VRIFRSTTTHESGGNARKGDVMRQTLIVFLAYMFVFGIAFAGEPEAPAPPGEGEEEKPKTPEEKRWDKIVEILQKLKATVEMEPGEEVDKLWQEVEKELSEVGPEAVPQLEPLLPQLDEKGISRFSETLRGILERDDWEAVELVERVMRGHKWVSPEDKAKLANLLEELRKKETKPEELFTMFTELKWFGVEGLRKEFEGTADQKLHEKIVGVLLRMAKQGALVTVPFLLDLTFDPVPAVRLKAMESLTVLAGTEDDQDWKKLDKLFQEEKAYPMFVGFLRKDPETDVRMYAARVLGRMSYKESAQELMNAIEDPKDRVQGEAAKVLVFYIATGVQDSDDWDKLVKSLKTWWRGAKAKFPKQLAALKPVRAKKEAKKKDEAE